MRIAKRLEDYRQAQDQVILVTDQVPIKIQFLTEQIIRIRTGFDNFEEASYSLVTTGWKDAYDKVLGSERKQITLCPIQIIEDDATLTITLDSSNTPTSESEQLKMVSNHSQEIDQADLEDKQTSGAVKCVVDKNPFRIRVFDGQGQCVHADIADLGYREDSNHRRLHTSQIAVDDCFYGFGEKTGQFNKAQSYLTMSPKDAMGYDPEQTDSLYKHIPFYIKLNQSTRTAVGYFYHNTWECDFNLGREKSNYWPRYSTYRANGGEIDLFLILGPQIRQVVQGFCQLTGTSALLPKRALGYLGSSMYYPELPKDCDQAIVSFVETCQKYGIDISGFQLSSGYTQQNTTEGLKRCVFTWNQDRFPDPARFFTQMEAAGVTVSPNVKPGILQCHPDFQKYVEAGLFVRQAENDQPEIGTWWGGPGSFIDFTNPQTRNAWKTMLTKKVLDYGVDSVWNDNCEYDSIVDLDARCFAEGKGATIGQLKSVMSNLMCQVANQAIAERFPGKRPFVVCRSGHTGIQRYAQTWAGDNLTCWEALRFNIATILGMGLSGVANQGADIGGFYGPAPEPELLVRWVQNGIFQPRFSIHSVNIDNTVTEPWMYPSVTPLIVQAMEYRVRLLPYLYSLMWRASRNGLPIMEPMCSAFQHDPHTYQEGIDFMVGDLLVANVVQAGATTREIYLPVGETFYHLPSGQRYQGGQTISLPVDLATVPQFLRGGGIFCRTAEPDSNPNLAESLEIICAPDRDGSFTLYQDDGETMAYQEGKYLATRLEMSSGTVTKLRFTSEGSYPDQYHQYQIQMFSPDKAPFFVQLDQQELEHYLDPAVFATAEEGWYYQMETRSVLVKYANPQADHTLTVSFEHFDMIGM